MSHQIRKLYTRAEMRSRNPKLAGELMSVVLNGSVRASSKSPDGSPLYDEEIVLTAAAVIGSERRLAARGEAIRSSAPHRAQQYTA